jgi:hypothetical protein
VNDLFFLIPLSAIDFLPFTSYSHFSVIRNIKDVDYVFNGVRNLLDQDISLVLTKTISAKPYLSPLLISTLFTPLVLCNAYKG